ncbi:uncharacterized protein B0P05DRAFT_589825 [Gilbertella persicaria]|uniref:uncharacterized protein n=1 Tax=Gilbertella persicaria TaxID=101096 RepID=UPI00221FD911|nr:uncharacterized protein B0P05DRAFT_589825 [Gilbertella persicaria]KAI8066232.1 hypothetical protein B0P05DRAFT_589825 [Gilbertella persicaria]
MLRPQYTRRPFELMILGRPNSGKRTLSDQLLKVKDVFFSINIAEDVPQRDLDRIDYVLILVDLTQEESLWLLDQSLHQMNARFLVKKSSVVVTKFDKLKSREIDIEQVKSVVTSFFDVPLFYVNLSNQIEKTRLCYQLTRKIKTETLQLKQINTSLLRCLEIYDSTDEEEESEHSILSERMEPIT